MNGRRRPRQPRWQPALNTLSIAACSAARLTSKEVEGIMAPLREAHAAMRAGVATEMQWCVLASSMEIALGIERQGVVRGLLDHLKSAELALSEISRRAMATGTWQPVPLHLQELDHLDAAVDLHAYQLAQLSEGELRAVTRRAISSIASQGGRVLEAIRTSSTEPAQLEML